MKRVLLYLFTENVSPEEIEEGKMEYLQHGKYDKNVCSLGPKTIVGRARMYQDFKLRRPSDSFLSTVMHMLGTKRYSLSSEFAGGYNGNKMLDRDRVDKLWKSYMQPDAFTESDLVAVLYSERDQERYMNSVIARRLVNEEGRELALDAMDQFMAEGGQPAGPGRAGYLVGLSRQLRADMAANAARDDRGVDEVVDVNGVEEVDPDGAEPQIMEGFDFARSDVEDTE